jgi:uncharacterized protein YkwD
MRRFTCAALIALFAVLGAGAVPAQAFDRAATEGKILRLVNHARSSRGLARVKVVRPLDRAALLHSRDMIVRGYFSHSSLAGASIATRARSAGYSTSGCSRWTVGEVIAWGSSSRGTPRSIFKSWMRSSTHRRVILTKRWRDVGIGCARGTYRGFSGAVMYTIDFGRRVQ